MEILMFILPSLLVAAAYLAPAAGTPEKKSSLPAFGPMCGCKQ